MRGEIRKRLERRAGEDGREREGREQTKREETEERPERRGQQKSEERKRESEASLFICVFSAQGYSGVVTYCREGLVVDAKDVMGDEKVS